LGKPGRVALDGTAANGVSDNKDARKLSWR